MSTRSTARLAPLFLLALCLATCGADTTPPGAAASRAALEHFAGGPVARATEHATIALEIPATGEARVKDTGLGLGWILGTGAILWLFKRGAGPKVRVFPIWALCAGIPLVFFANPTFWEWKSASLEADLLRVDTHTGTTTEARWTDVAGVRYVEGKPFPLFVDDAALELVTKDGRVLTIVRGSGEPKTIAAFVASKITLAD